RRTAGGKTPRAATTTGSLPCRRSPLTKGRRVSAAAWLPAGRHRGAAAARARYRYAGPRRAHHDRRGCRARGARAARTGVPSRRRAVADGDGGGRGVRAPGTCRRLARARRARAGKRGGSVSFVEVLSESELWIGEMRQVLVGARR